MTLKMILMDGKALYIDAKTVLSLCFMALTMCFSVSVILKLGDRTTAVLHIYM